jgi:ABC-type glycerol-3-phosphate transport system substrate-binding protein
MQPKGSFFILTFLILSFVLIIGACRRATTPETPTLSSTPSPTQGIGHRKPVETSSRPTELATEPIGAPTTEQPYPLMTYPGIPETVLPYPQPSSEVFVPTLRTTSGTTYPTPSPTITQPVTQTPQASQTPISNSPTPTETSSFIPSYPGVSPNPAVGATLPYPGPGFTSTSPAYPGPEYTSTYAAYPGPATSTPHITQTPSKSITAGATPAGTIFPTTVPPQGTGTPLVTPIEMPPRLPLSPPPPGSSVTIWHSWGNTETEALKSIIQSFQRLYPDVTFSLQFIPLDDLFSAYYEAAYQGHGPSLLLGPSNWGPELFNETLITNLDPYVPANYLVNISPAALSSGEYKDSLISLPLSQHGLLMFRNTSLIPTSPTSMDELMSLSHQATHGGIVGSYLERGSYFSSPAIIGLGGHLMDENGYPAFNDQFGLEWLDLLDAYDEAGAVTFNTNWDLEKFKQSRTGIIIDGSWNTSMLAQSIGIGNLAIDPWPTYGTGHLSGWVETDSIYLNANTTGNDRFAALSFMGYLLDPNVQMRLAEVGHIPSVITTQPRDMLIKQAMMAFVIGAPYPVATDNSVLSIYRSELDKVIRDVFDRGIDPVSALQTADNNIRQSLEEMESIP